MLARRRLKLSSHVCCKQHRWTLLDMLDQVASLSCENPVIETVSFTEKLVALNEHLVPTHGAAVSLADRIMKALDLELGGNSCLFNGRLTLEAILEIDDKEVQQNLEKLSSKGYAVEITEV